MTKNASLVWKQWREDRTYFVLFSILMILMALYVVGYEMGHRFRTPVGDFSGLAWHSALLGAVLLAMRTARGEHDAGVLAYTRSLPAESRRIAGIRLWGAILTLTLPLLMAGAILALALATGVIEQVTPRAFSPSVGVAQRATASTSVGLQALSSVVAIAVLGGVEVLILLSWIGCRLRSQAQIGFLGAVVGFGAILASGVFWFSQGRPIPQLAYGALFPMSLVIHWGYGEPKGSYVDHVVVPNHGVALGLSLLVLWILGRQFLRCYAIESRLLHSLPRRFQRCMTPATWFRIPLRSRSRWAAIAWLELRQSVPLTLAGLGLALLMTLADLLIEVRPSHNASTQILMQMPHSTFAVGMLWSVVVATSLFSAELSPGLGAFWRSRPISPATWFWSKYGLGLMAVILILDGITSVIAWNAPRDSMTTGMSWSYVACMPIVHGVMFSMTVCGTCLLRNSILGGFAAFLAFGVLGLAVGAFPATAPFAPIEIYNQLLREERLGMFNLGHHGYPMTYGVLLLLSLATALCAFQFAKPFQLRSRT